MLHYINHDTFLNVQKAEPDSVFGRLLQHGHFEALKNPYAALKKIRAGETAMIIPEISYLWCGHISFATVSIVRLRVFVRKWLFRTDIKTNNINL